MSRSAFLFAALLIGNAFVFSTALAHSSVSPSRTSVSTYETFTVSVPTEKEIPTTGIRLLVPDSLDRVTPVVKPGWRIQVVKDADGNVTELLWTGGSIPREQKDLFQFTARTAASSTTLVWKVYQTYQDGEVVAWDRDPNQRNEGEERVPNPYSVTEVSEDVPAEPVSAATTAAFPIALSGAALVISLAALWIAATRRHEL